MAIREEPFKDSNRRQATILPPRKSTAFRIIDVARNYGTATTEDLFLTVFYGATEASAIAQIYTRLDRMARDTKGRVNILTIVQSRAPMPDENARKALATAGRNLTEQSNDVHSAVVFQGSPAKVYIVSAVAAGLSLIARYPLPIKIFNSIDAAATWLAPSVRSIEVNKTGDIAVAVEELDRRHAAKFPTQV